MSQEFDLGEVEMYFISFVPRGANRKKYFLVKEDRPLKEDILKSILETDEGEVSRILKEARLEGEAAGVLEAAAKLLKSADAVLEKSELFQEFGKAGSKESSAEGQIYAKARAMVVKDGDLTFEEAVEKVMDLEPELYEKAEAERQERIARRGK